MNIDKYLMIGALLIETLKLYWVEVFGFFSCVLVYTWVVIKLHRPRPGREATNAKALAELKCKDILATNLKEYEAKISELTKKYTAAMAAEYTKGKRDGHAEGHEAGNTDAKSELRESMAVFLSTFAEQLRNGDVSIQL